MVSKPTFLPFFHIIVGMDNRLWEPDDILERQFGSSTFKLRALRICLLHPDNATAQQFLSADSARYQFMIIIKVDHQQQVQVIITQQEMAMPLPSLLSSVPSMCLYSKFSLHCLTTHGTRHGSSSLHVTHRPLGPRQRHLCMLYVGN